jgi:hypothetical protein
MERVVWACDLDLLGAGEVLRGFEEKSKLIVEWQILWRDMNGRIFGTVDALAEEGYDRTVRFNRGGQGEGAAVFESDCGNDLFARNEPEIVGFLVRMLRLGTLGK